VAPGSDEVGEIVASGDNVTAGYWRDPEETRKFFRDGKLHTGDLARVDADGFIYVVERARDFIKSMGNRISPKEIEEVVAEMPEVVEAAVVGVPDELWGEAIRAHVVPVRPGAVTAEAVRAHCLKRLPNHKIPQQVVVTGALPKTSSGKVDKVRLRSA
jgi:acyl-CoA synthetase (AMP-forming)/AMP-acid ligase II